MKIHRRYKSAMDRQLGEAICIARAGGMDSETVMNSKDEYSRCILPEIEMTGSRRWAKAKTEGKRQRKLSVDRDRYPKRQKRETDPPEQQHTNKAHNTAQGIHLCGAKC